MAALKHVFRKPWHNLMRLMMSKLKSQIKRGHNIVGPSLFEKGCQMGPRLSGELINKTI